MRVSATSKIASPAGIAPAQGKTNAGKTDQASPFSLLVDSMTPKDSVKDSGKPPQKDTSNASGKDDKSVASTPANANPADQQGGQDDNTANTGLPDQTKSASNAKTGKQDQPDDKDGKTKAADGTADADPTSILQLLELQAPPAQPPTQPSGQTTAAPANDDDSGDMPVGNVGATAPATPATPATPGIAQDAAAPTTPAPKPSDLAAAQVPPAPEDDKDNQSEDAPAPPTAAAQALPQISAPATPAPKSVAGKAATSEKPSVSADTQIASADTGKSDAVKDSQATKPDVRIDTAKDDRLKPGETAKGQTGQAAGGKTDTNKYAIGKPGSDNTNDARDATHTAAAPQVQPAETPDTAPKAAPHPAPPAVFAINNIAAPQAAQNSAVAQAVPNQAAVNQHVQVSAQPAPNLPALAVEIAAKSQSGSKQFDIRLDPPELGRVDVRLSIDATGKASAHLSADQPQTLTLLQKDAPALTRALRDAGLDVSQDGLNFSLRQQADNSNGNAAGSNRRGGSARNFSLTATASIEPGAATAAYRGLANERLDIRV